MGNPDLRSADREPTTGGLVVLLAVGLAMCEIYKGFLTPLLPVLIQRFELTMTTAGALTTTLLMSAALGQVLWGQLGDRLGRKALLVIGPGVTAVMAGLLGVLPNGGLLGVLLVLIGLAASIYPPQAAVLVGRIGRDRRRDSGLGLLFMAGILGGGSSALVAVPLVEAVGLERLYLSAAAGVLFSAILAWRVSTPAMGQGPGSSLSANKTSRHRWQWPLLALLAISILRATTSMGFSTFIPVLMSQKGLSLLGAGSAFTLYMYCGALGTVVGARLVDRWGPRSILLLSLLLPTPFFLAFGYTDGPVAFCCLGLGSVALYSSLTINVSLGQRLLPRRSGMVSALMMGFSWGLGSLATTGVGALADRLGVADAMTIAACVPLVTLPLVLTIPFARIEEV